MANNLNYPTTTATPGIALRVTQQAFTSIAANTHSDFSLTVPGSLPEMTFDVNMPFLDGGLGIGNVWCSAAGTVKLRLVNVTTGAITPSTQDFYLISR